MKPLLEIIFQDKYLVAINKPHGLLVHKTDIAKDTSEYALQKVRDQVGRKVYPVHRLDRKTSGVLLFAKDAVTNRGLQEDLESQNIAKQYLAIVRGYFPEKAEVDYPVINARGKMKPAVTHFRIQEHTELPIPLGQHQTSRYSLIEAFPKTGRMHQIRRHLNHLRHPIIGDRPHGCSKQNRLFKEKWKMTTMLLHARKLTFTHPFYQKKITLVADVSAEMNRMIRVLGFKNE